MVWLLPVCLVAVVWAAALRKMWVAWLVPVAIGVLFFIAWRREATWTAGGDPQPGLVAFVGLVSVGILVAGIVVGNVVGTWVRRRASSGRTRR